jgi:hypothetical protein
MVEAIINPRMIALGIVRCGSLTFVENLDDKQGHETAQEKEANVEPRTASSQTAYPWSRVESVVHGSTRSPPNWVSLASSSSASFRTLTVDWRTTLAKNAPTVTPQLEGWQ